MDALCRAAWRGVAGEKDHGDITGFPDRFEALVEHVVDYQTAANKKVVDLGGFGFHQYLIHIAKADLVGIDQNGEFLFPSFFGCCKVLVDVVCHVIFACAFAGQR